MIEEPEFDQRVTSLTTTTSSSHGLGSFRRRLWRYGPVVLWASLIFIGSGNVLSASHTSIVVRAAHWLFPSASDESLLTFHFLVRKAGHLTEYAILAVLAARAFRTSSRQFITRHWFWIALLFAGLYALSDEFHQSFIPSRTASIGDSLIDSVGALVGLLIRWGFSRKARSARTAQPLPS